MKDLHFYYQFLTSHPDPDSLLGPTVLLSIRELVKVRHFRRINSVKNNNIENSIVLCSTSNLCSRQKCFTWSTADFALTQVKLIKCGVIYYGWDFDDVYFCTYIYKHISKYLKSIQYKTDI